MAGQRVAALAGAFALCFLIAGVVVHNNSRKSELLQDEGASDQVRAARLDALRELGSKSFQGAYLRGYREGEEAAEKEAEPHLSPALLKASESWKMMMLAQLRAKEQEEKTEEVRKEVQAAKKVALAMKAAEASEPAAWNKYNAQLKEQGQRMQLAEKAEKASEPAAWNKYHAELKEQGKRVQLALKAEKAAWNNEGLKLEQKAELAMQAEKASELGAMKAANDERKRVAEARLALLHSAMQKHYTQQLIQMDGEEHKAEQRAAKLYEFCAKQFPAADGLRKFCFEKLSQPPSGKAIDDVLAERQAVPEDQEFTGRTLEGAIDKAHAAGETGMPKYVVFHPADGHPEAFKLQPVEYVADGSSLAQRRAERAERAERFERLQEERRAANERNPLHEAIAMAHEMGMRGEPKSISITAPNVQDALAEARALGLKGEPQSIVAKPAAADEGPVEVTGKTLQSAIRRAHAMGLHGEPEFVVYHPDNKPAEVFQREQ